MITLFIGLRDGFSYLIIFLKFIIGLTRKYAFYYELIYFIEIKKIVCEVFWA